MKTLKIFISILFLILVSVLVSGKCGDRFCDPDENCQSCSNDCLCWIGEETHKVTTCCSEFDCKECEKGYCENRRCDSLKSVTSMFKEVDCNPNGSVSLHIELITLGSSNIRSDSQIKVFMKPDNIESSFKEIKGVWKSKEFNPSYPNILKEESFFNSDLNVFDEKGKYWIRVKFQKGGSSILYEDYLVSCPEVIKEVKIEEPIKEVPKEEPEETPIEPEIQEPEKTITTEQPLKEQNKGFLKRLINYVVKLFS